MKGGVWASLFLFLALSHPEPLGLPPAARASLSPCPQACSAAPHSLHLPQLPQDAAEILLSLMPSETPVLGQDPL